MNKVDEQLTIRHSVYTSMLREGNIESSNFREYNKHVNEVQQSLCSSVERVLDVIVAKIGHSHLERK